MLTQQGIEFLVTFHQKAEPKLAQLWIFYQKQPKQEQEIFRYAKLISKHRLFLNKFDGNKIKTFSVFSRFTSASSQST